MIFILVLFSVGIREARKVHVVHQALAVAGGVEDVQGGGFGDVPLVEGEVQGLNEVVRVRELPQDIPGLVDIGHVPVPSLVSPCFGMGLPSVSS